MRETRRRSSQGHRRQAVLVVQTSIIGLMSAAITIHKTQLQNTQSSLATSLPNSAQNSLKKNGDGTIFAENNSLAPLNNQSSVMEASNFSRATSLSNQLLAQRKIFAESQTGRFSFWKLLEPSLHQRPGIAPYRVVLGNVKDKLMKTRQRLELFLEDLPCEHDPVEYYETTDQLLELLLLCYNSLQSCGSSILADGRLANLIRRLSTFGMILMKHDLHQESSRHAETLDASTIEISDY